MWPKWLSTHGTQKIKIIKIIYRIHILEVLCVEVSGRIQYIHQVAIEIYSGFLLHLFFKPDQVVYVIVSLTRSIFCEHLLKSFNSCVLPCLTISGGGPFQWNTVGHHLLDFITEGNSELLDQCVSGVTGIK